MQEQQTKGFCHYITCPDHFCCVTVLMPLCRHPRLSHHHGHGDVSGVSLRWVWAVNFYHPQRLQRRPQSLPRPLTFWSWVREQTYNKATLRYRTHFLTFKKKEEEKEEKLTVEKTAINSSWQIMNSFAHPDSEHRRQQEFDKHDKNSIRMEARCGNLTCERLISVRALKLKWVTAEQVSFVSRGLGIGDNLFSWGYVFKFVSNVFKGTVLNWPVVKHWYYCVMCRGGIH